MAVFLSPIGNGGQYFTTGGLPLNGGFLNTYQAGTTTPQATFTTSAGNVANPVSIQLGTDGRPPAGIWLTAGIAYKFILTDSLGAQAGPPMDNISGIGDGTALAATTGAALVGVTGGGTVQTALNGKAALGANADITSLTGLTNPMAASRVQDLIGAPNATTPLTKYDLSADAVVLRNSTGGTVTRYLTGAITNDLGLAGSAANGRDQVAAFTASSWIYLYFIWNGTTLATISSTAVPTTGPTLPTGYTHWAFATALRWNASSNIIPTLTKCCQVIYDIATGGVTSAIPGGGFGVATVMTAIPLSGLVPPISPIAKFLVNLPIAHNVASTSFNVFVRPTGSTIGGKRVATITSIIASQANQTTVSMECAIGTGQQIDYKLDQAPNVSGGLVLDVESFKIPNGDS